MRAEVSSESNVPAKRELWYGALVSSKFRTALGLAGIVIGVGLFINVIHSTDFSDAPGALTRVGIWGLLALLLPYSIAAMFDTEAWRRLLTSNKRHPSFPRIFRIRTATEALVITVPLGSIISDPAKAWMLKRQLGYPLSTTAASVVFRKTMLGFSQGIVGVLVAIVSLSSPASFHSSGIGEGLAWTLLAFASVVVTIYGVFLGFLCNSRFVDRFHGWLTQLPFERLARWFETKEQQFLEFNRQLQPFRGIGSVVRFTSAYAAIWLTENIETLLILFLLGANLTLPQAMLMEVTCVLIRASTPMVPGGIGIQDTGYVTMMMASGNSGEIAAAFVLLKRFRELLWATVGYILLLVARKKKASMKTPSMTDQARRILFICGSMNQTTQLHKIARELEVTLPDYEQCFTPYYVDGILEPLRKWKWLNFTIAGDRSAGRVFEYCEQNGLRVDYRGKHGPYDLVVTCCDLFIPRNTRRSPIVLVQEGMTDPEGWAYQLVRHIRLFPRWVASTAMMGLSRRYTRFCVASEAYRQLFIRKGAPGRKLVVTGIPNFDDCAKHLDNNFPLHGYFLVCTSDMRETFMPENRKKFILSAVEHAAGRPMLFKLHPNERWGRAKREIEEFAPCAMIFTSGNTEEMIANCSGFMTHYSSTVYVALALGKEVHCDLDVEELARLLPLQNWSGARNIARVCREVVAETTEESSAQTISYSFARHPLLWTRAFYRGLRTIPE